MINITTKISANQRDPIDKTEKRKKHTIIIDNVKSQKQNSGKVEKNYGSFVVNMPENLKFEDEHKFSMYILITKKFQSLSGEYITE